MKILRNFPINESLALDSNIARRFHEMFYKVLHPPLNMMLTLYVCKKIRDEESMCKRGACMKFGSLFI